MNSSISKNKRILITGAGGFLGKNLTKAVLSEGMEVFAVDIYGLDPLKNIPGITVVQEDFRDIGKMAPFLREVDAVCHLAAYIPPDFNDSSYAHKCMEINATGTLTLAETILKENPNARLLYLSAGNAYFSKDVLNTESAPLYPAGKAVYYLTSKIAGEFFLEHLRKTRGLNSFCFRLTSPYGFGMPERTALGSFMNSACKGETLRVFGGGRDRSDFVYIKDVVKLMVSAIKGGAPGVYNIGSGKHSSLLDLAEAVQNVFPEKKLNIEILPPLSDSMPIVFPCVSLEKVKKEWNFIPVSLDEALTDFRNEIEKNS